MTQLWLVKTLSRLSQTKQDATRWLPELCTTKATWHKKRRKHYWDFTGIIPACSYMFFCRHLQQLGEFIRFWCGSKSWVGLTWVSNLALSKLLFVTECAFTNFTKNLPPVFFGLNQAKIEPQREESSLIYSTM